RPASAHLDHGAPAARAAAGGVGHGRALGDAGVRPADVGVVGAGGDALVRAGRVAGVAPAAAAAVRLALDLQGPDQTAALDRRAVGALDAGRGHAAHRRLGEARIVGADHLAIQIAAGAGAAVQLGGQALAVALAGHVPVAGQLG